MNKILFVCFLLAGVVSHAKLKTVSIPREKAVVFQYDTDSSTFEHKENIKFIRTFYSFYNSIYTNDTAAYFKLLSPATIETIKDDKLRKKFGRYKSYIPQLTGTIVMEWIKLVPEKFIETEPMYMCVVKLPGDKKATHRVGFDPAKRFYPTDESYIGLILVKLGDEFKVVIPW